MATADKSEMIRCTFNVRAVESGRKSKILIFWQKWSGRQQRIRLRNSPLWSMSRLLRQSV